MQGTLRNGKVKEIRNNGTACRRASQLASGFWMDRCRTDVLGWCLYWKEITMLTPAKELEILKEAISLIKPSYEFMLTDIKRRADITGGGNYSQEMLNAISAGKLLEKL